MSSFAPWRTNRISSWLWIAGGASVLWLTWQDVIHWQVGVAGATAMFAYAYRQRCIAASREFGKQIEQRVLPWAVTVLKEAGASARPNVRLKSGADVDLLVTKNGRRITVEIKSFVYWKTFLFFWNGRREAAAVRQARGQKRELDADHAIIWLPQGRKSVWQKRAAYPRAGGGVHLVFGNAKQLAAAITHLAS